ncbi:maleylpyruvate isomerase family mycothiol-dependent enzyme [Actinoplanes sp. LDG1-06]|uniref:Maleylpyruvate isomerase family mycothiol-dependent enzyme n=1 Tax=Paractinoplanes ovalisporus TaxID=2810368 RepID=A0ABS2ALJ9_9ACTN|nr:maleylpyruvate isomerase family mycothiol-dependent enzyme [Actinoplanes ovalisporus]MBM2620671.1 maleylpyruvate isomerase family mycothiol-dependent enzyme [Actinoplanes ovalisporus]
MDRILELIDERSAAFRAAVAAAPSLDVPVPSCPGWTLADLVGHIGNGRRKWAAIVAAGPADTPVAWEAVEPGEDVDAWLAESTRLMLDALREAGPEQGCWTWWGDSQSPQNCGAAARHQLQEIAVHTYDAQLAGGAPQPLPDEVALDGVDEFLRTCASTTSPWPHAPATLDHRVTGGRTWRLWLSADGARLGEPTDAPADGTLEGTANELVLLFYGRVELDSLKLDGDRRIYQQLIDWDPSA